MVALRYYNKWATHQDLDKRLRQKWKTIDMQERLRGKKKDEKHPANKDHRK